MVLQYSDDFLSACTDPQHHTHFREALQKHFNADWQSRADWYLQARIQQDKDGNIYLDQQHYAKAVVKRYIPNASFEVTEDDKCKYASPLPANVVLCKEDKSTTREQVHALNEFYFFDYRSFAASANYWFNTTV